MSPARRSFNLAPTPATDRAEDWRHNIPPCANVEPELFYVPGDIKAWERPEHAEQLAIVRGLCGPCPLRSDCLAGAIEQGDKHTFRGNTTPAERDSLRRKAKRPSTRGAKPAKKCVNGHDTSQPGSRLPNRDCRQCARDRSARQRAKQKEAQAS